LELHAEHKDEVWQWRSVEQGVWKDLVEWCHRGY